MKWIRRHFRRYRERTPWDFCWRIAIEGTIVGLAASCLIGFLDMAGREIDLSFGALLIGGVVVAPVLETLILQAFPVWLARQFKAGFSLQIIVSVIPFAVLHAVEGIQTAIAAGLVGGFYFAFTYVHWRERSRWQAYWITAASHSIHNAIVFTLAFVLGEI
jgi:hypothetical protein